MLDRRADLAQPFDSLRRAEGRLGRRREHRSKKNVVRAAFFGGARGFQRMAGNSDPEIRSSARNAATR